MFQYFFLTVHRILEWCWGRSGIPLVQWPFRWWPKVCVNQCGGSLLSLSRGASFQEQIDWVQQRRNDLSRSLLHLPSDLGLCFCRSESVVRALSLDQPPKLINTSSAFSSFLWLGTWSSAAGTLVQTRAKCFFVLSVVPLRWRRYSRWLSDSGDLTVGDLHRHFRPECKSIESNTIN